MLVVVPYRVDTYCKTVPWGTVGLIAANVLVALERLEAEQVRQVDDRQDAAMKVDRPDQDRVVVRHEMDREIIDDLLDRLDLQAVGLVAEFVITSYSIHYTKLYERGRFAPGATR